MSNKTVKYKQIAKRIAFEIRFRPNLAYFDELFSRASVFEDEFEDWEVGYNPQQIHLYSQTDKQSLKVLGDRIIWITEGKPSFTDTLLNIRRVFEILLIPDDINPIRRVGVRSTVIYEIHDYKLKDLITSLFGTFYGSQKDLNRISADEVADVVLVLDGVKNGFKNHIKIGPINQGEADTVFGTNFNESRVEIKQESNILVDTDIFIDEEQTIQDSLSIIDDLVNEAKRIPNDYLEYIKGVAK